MLHLWPSRMHAAPVVLFTFLWLRFLWRWYALILLTSADESRGFLLVFGLPFALAGMSLIATSVRMVLGTSRIALDALRLHIVEEGAFGAERCVLTAPVTGLRVFIAECSEGEECGDLGSWHVGAELDGGRRIRLPLPVRSMTEAEHVAQRLNRALATARAPSGYRH